MEIVYSPHNRNYASYSFFLATEASQNLFCGERKNGGDLNSYNEFQCRKPISTRLRRQERLSRQCETLIFVFRQSGVHNTIVCAARALVCRLCNNTRTKKSALNNECAFS